MLYYLSDVTRGGETAFPVADEEDFNQTVLFPIFMVEFFSSADFFSLRVLCFVVPLPTMG